MPILTNQASRLLGGGVRALAVPVPTLGAEKLTNGDFETDDPPTGWNANASSALASAADPRTGSTGTACIQITRGSDTTAGYRTFSTSAGQWLIVSAWVKNVDATGAYVQLAGTTGSISSTTRSVTSWGEVYVVDRGAGASGTFRLGLSGTAGKICKYDDCSVKAITLASMFSTSAYGTHQTTKAKATIVTGTRAGVVANLDSASAPSSFVIASHDGTTARLTKCVAGTYTELISTAVAYSAGAYVEIRRLAGTDTFQLWYNGSQVGTNQTITDLGIVSNVLAGMFNTYSGNQLSDFSCVASA